MIINQPISEDKYKEALKRLGSIFDASSGTEEFTELTRLYQLIEKYEKTIGAVLKPKQVRAE